MKTSALYKVVEGMKYIINLKKDRLFVHKYRRVMWKKFATQHRVGGAIAEILILDQLHGNKL